MASISYSSDDAKWAAVRSRDEEAEGHFIYCVKTTKICCRTTCKARLARRANVEFFNTVSEAQAAGYRACKRCKPELATYIPEADQAIEKVRNTLESLPTTSPLPKLEEMAAQAGLTKYHFHRQFKRATGLTPREYALSRRQSHHSAALSECGAVNSDSTMSTPSFLLEIAPTSTSQGTPHMLLTPDLTADDWLMSSPDDPILFDDYGPFFGPSHNDFEHESQAPAPILFQKSLDREVPTTMTIHYSAVETTHGVLAMAFEGGQICKMELLPSLQQAISALTSSFPAPLYLLVSLDDLAVEQRSVVSQQVLAIVQALENPLASTLTLQRS